MFTGLISHIGYIENVRRRGSGAAQITIRARDWDPPLQTGESIAVQGVCLTVASYSAEFFCCDLLQQTLRLSTLGRLRSGSPVNLERALRAGDRLGGHLVSGHIDGQGTCASIRGAGPDRVLEIRAAGELLQELVPRGSVACDGVSLTVSHLGTDHFKVQVIPHTWSASTLQWLRPGDPVNLETDLIGKHATRRPAAKTITLESLRNSGFAV